MCTTDFRALMDIFTKACEKAENAATDVSVSSEENDAPLAGHKRARSPESSGRGERNRGSGGTGTFKRRRS